MKNKKTVLILISDFRKRGGQPAYWKILSGYMEKEFNIRYFRRGRRGESLLSWIVSPFVLLYDYIRFFIMCIVGEAGLIHINTAFNIKSMVRDGIFMLIARLSGKDTILFFHGWYCRYGRIIEGRLFLCIWKRLFFYSRVIIVLAESFRDRLLAWGYEGRVVKESTFIDDRVLEELREEDMEGRLEKSRDDNRFNILFMSRIEREKGILETILAFTMLREKYRDIRLKIAGDGSLLKKLRSNLGKAGEKGIDIEGFCKEDEKKRLFDSSDIFMLPTYNDAMPISVIEAMAWGLPVITRSEGGIADFFIEGKMGFITESRSPKVFAELIERLYNDRDMLREISLYNYRYARANFRASDAGKRMTELYRSIDNGQG